MSNATVEINRSHDNMSYSILFKEHSRLIFKLINNFIKAKNINLNQTEVDDIYQEIALKMFKNDYLSRYNNEKSSFITWLNIICRTTTIDYYRKKLRWMESILSKEDDIANTVADDNAAFSLPPNVLTKRQAQVITLFFREGMIAGEIAEALDITSRTVRSIKFQALERLRNHYGASTPNHMPDEIEARRRVS